MRDPRAILITGASSGIGAALARTYARDGLFLALIGNDPTRTREIAETCRRQGAAVEHVALDVTDQTALAAWIATVDRAHPLDLVIANAGISAGTGGGGESEEQAHRILAVNIDGVLNTVFPALAGMIARRSGQIALMSSLAGFRGFPGAPTYCASKAFVRIWGEALRGELARHGIGVSVICPGFVASRMTAVNTFRMPLLMHAERAAAIIVRGLARNRPRIAFPWRMYAGTRLLAALPPRLADFLLARLPKKS
ncbi:MAG: SDR family NAD(P)-dependent oxidoreductase [Proteobacteria bacterium]|nr:SDR family NAD(P)-dependent oxidoreductase [Pseudomonadota bacterium]